MDTLSVSEVVDLSKTIIDAQSNLFSNHANYLMWIISLFVVLAGAWNIYISKRGINKAVTKEIAKHKDELVKQLNITIKSNVDEMSHKIERKMNINAGEISRAMAITCVTDDDHYAAIGHLMSAINYYLQSDEQHLVRITFDSLLEALSITEVQDKLISEGYAYFNKEELIETLDLLPDYFLSDVQVIRKIIARISKESGD
ncbi:MAG: hypothetical protein HQ528_01985 [Candidatus Marinimicrobia bacterium]|nr:hypothetical protein [Candidatus Neomarinimicrobiota bacterium]